MTRKERIKTYLIGVAIGVAALVIWESAKSRSQQQPPQTPGVPSASDASPAPGTPAADPEASRRTP